MTASLLLLVLAATPWHWDNPLPQGNTLNGGWSDGPRVILVGAGGTILRSPRGAQALERVYSDASVDLDSVWSNGPDIYAVGSTGPGGMRGALVASHDGGQTWHKAELDQRLGGVWGSGPDEVFVVGSAGLVLRSGDRGQRWQREETGTTDYFLDVQGRSSGTVYATTGGASGGVFARRAGRWQRWVSARENVHALCELPKDGLLAVGNAGLVLRRESEGAWRTGLGGAARNLYGLHCGSDGQVVAVGDEGVFVSRDGGMSWQVVGAAQALRGVVEVGDGELVAFGVGGALWQLTPAAGTLRRLNGPDPALRAIWSSGADVYAVGYGGRILRGSLRSGRAERWTSLASGTTTALTGVWGSSARDVWIVGQFGELLHSTDGGDSWEHSQLGVTGGDFSIWGTGPNEIYVAGASGVLLRSVDRGQTWSPLDTGSDRHLQAVWGTGPEDLWVTGDNGVILHSTSRGRQWSRLEVWQPQEGVPARDLHTIWGDGHGTVFTGGYSDGRLFITRDGGRSWSSLVLPGAGPIRTVCGNGREVLALRDWGVVARSFDGGRTFELDPSPAVGGLNALACDPEHGVFGVGHFGALVHRPWSPARRL